MPARKSGNRWVLVIVVIGVLLLVSPVAFYWLGRLLLEPLASGFELVLSTLPIPSVYVLIAVLLIIAWYALGVLLLARRQPVVAVLLLYLAVAATVLVVRAFAAVSR